MNSVTKIPNDQFDIKLIDETKMDFISNTLIDLILGNPEMLIKNNLPYANKSNNVFVKDDVKGKNYE